MRFSRTLAAAVAPLAAIFALALVLLLSAGSGMAVVIDPAVLNTNATTDSGNDSDVDLATDGAGNWVAVWYSYDSLGGTIGTDRDILVARSNNNGATWTAPIALNTNATSDSGNDFRPHVATDGAGNWVAAWDSDDNLGATIGTDRDILVARSTDNGATWTAPIALNNNATTDSGFDYEPNLTTDGIGNWVAVWDSYDSLGGTIGTDRDVLVARSTDNGAMWTAPAALNTNATTDSNGDERAQVTTDGAGNWVAVWQSTENLGGTIGTDLDILVARSTDNGATWTAPAALNTNATTDSGHDVSPYVGTDGAGNWVAVWSSVDSLGGTIGTDNDILVARSTDNGATWTAPSTLNTNANTDSGNDFGQRVATDGAGNWVTVWQSQDSLGGTIGTDTDILVARSTDNGATWTAPAALNTNASTDSGYDFEPHVTTDGAGNWVAVWDSNDSLGDTIGTDRDILYVNCLPVLGVACAGVTATSLNTNAATDSGGDVEPHLTTDGTGNWVAVWQSQDSLGGTIGTDLDILVARSTDNGATWTAPAALNTNATTDSGNDHDFRPHVATDGAGDWVAVWESMDTQGGTIGPDWDILVARSTDNGATWTAPVALNTNATTDSGNDSEVDLATDGAGNWVAVWYSYDSLGGTIGTDRDILVARSTDNGATWTAPAALNTNAPTDSGNDFSPYVATDGAGNWVAVWDSDDSLGGTIGTDRDILVARSTDNGATWTAPIALNTNATTDSGNDYQWSLTTDGAGNWVAVWHSYDSLGGTIGTDSDILVARSTDNGATWTAPATLNTNAATDSGGDVEPHLTTDGTGNWVAVWQSQDSLGGTIGTDLDILVSRSTDDGATWRAPAALTTNATTDAGRDKSAHVATDGAHWVAVWSSDDSLGGTVGTDDDILYVNCLPVLGVACAGATATYIVNSDDDVDDGACDADHCSLREAIDAANEDAGTDTIEFDIPGVGPHTITPGSALPTITDPVIIDGTTQPGFAGSPIIELDGTSLPGNVDGLVITAGGSTVKGLVINRFGDHGIRLETNGSNTVQGNYIGTDTTGLVDEGNGDYGVFINGVDANTIGGAAAGEGNVISGNILGVRISGSGATGNELLGNYIGTDFSGTADLGNTIPGVLIDGAASGNYIGGTASGEGNVISGNNNGIEISGSGTTDNKVQGNYIGTDKNGTAALGNTTAGVVIMNSSGANNTVGGTVAGARNVISANGFYGVNLGPPGSKVQGNYIGTDKNGTAALGNVLDGVFVTGGPGITIGGTSAGARNVISGNVRYGVRLSGSGTTGNMIQGNYIGTQPDGTSALGNGSTGLYIVGDAYDNVIGLDTAGVGMGNTIAYNTGDGVDVNGASSTGNTIRGNSIHSNSGLGIDLTPGGVTANDTDDPDVGANNLQNYPVLDSALYTAGNTAVEGSLNSLATTTFTIEFFTNSSCDGLLFGEGETLVDSTSVTTDGTPLYEVAISVTLTGVSVGDFLTSTATDPSGNTSEFSACEEVLLDSDGDGVPDTTDVCPNDANDDIDGDGICVGNGFSAPKTGDNDNCPTTPNSGQANDDGDQWGNACDNCPSTATGWFVPVGDTDCDGSVTGDVNSGETFFGTDPADPCSDTVTPYDERGSTFGEPEPAWPPDINDDQVADFGDILPFAAHFNKTFPDPDYSARFDFFTDGTIDFGDILSAYVPVFNKDCTDYFTP